MRTDEIKSKAEDQLFTPRFLILLVYSFLMATSYYLVTPLLTKHISSMGYSLTMAGLLASSMTIAALVFRPLSGAMADCFNKKRVLLLAALIMCVGTAELAFVQSFVLLFVFRLLQGIGYSVYGTLTVVTASESMPISKIGTGIGYFSIATIIAQAVGPYLGSLMDVHFGTGKTFFISAVVCGVSCLALLPMKYNFVRTKPLSGCFHIKNMFSLKLLPIMLFAVPFSFNSGLVSSFMALSAGERNIANYAVFFMVNTVFIALLRPLTGRMFDRKGFCFVMIPAFLCGIAALILVGVAGSVWILCVAALAFALSHGTASPVCQAQCAKELPPEQRGLAISSYYFAADIAHGISSAVGGTIADHVGYQMMYFSGAGIYLVALAAFIPFYWKRNRRKGNL